MRLWEEVVMQIWQQAMWDNCVYIHTYISTIGTSKEAVKNKSIYVSYLL